MPTFSHQPLKIFVSYGHDENTQLVDRIVGDLSKRGHDLWVDRVEIKSGQDWRKRISQGIAESDLTLAFLSRHSTRDPGVCLDEIGIALSLMSGGIATILVEKESDVQPPASISHLQWLDMQDWKSIGSPESDKWKSWYGEKFGELVSIVESGQTRTFTGEIAELREYLRPASSSTRIQQLVGKPLVGREPLLNEVEDWRTGDQFSQMFWITGPPGVGKSAFAAHLAHRKGDHTIAAHFCQYDRPEHNQANTVIRSLAFQIAARMPDYRELLLRRPMPCIEKMLETDAAQLFDLMLAEPLQMAIDGNRDRCLLVIDALDEATSSGRNELAELLARQSSSLPAWIGIVVTSRPESNVSVPFQGIEPHPMVSSTDWNNEDIRRYLRRELADVLSTSSHADDVIDSVLEKSDGLFLYAERFCEDLRMGYLSIDQPEHFPNGLAGVFHQYLGRKFPDVDDYRKRIRPALQVVLGSRESMPVQVLCQMFGWQKHLGEEFVRSLGTLFTTQKEHDLETIRPWHKSFADWLTDPGRSNEYQVDLVEGTDQLADFLISINKDDHYRLLPYARRNIARLLLDRRKWAGLVQAVYCPHFELIHRWTARGEQTEGESCLRGAIEYLLESEKFVIAAELSTQYARVLVRLDKHALAEKALRDAAAWISNEVQPKTRAIIWHELGSLLFYQGKNDEASELYKRALDLAKQSGPDLTTEVAANLVAMATIAQSNQQFDQAIELCDQSLPHAESCGDIRHNIAARRVRANALRCKFRFGEATEELAVAKMMCVLHEFSMDETSIMLSESWLEYERSIVEQLHNADIAEPLFTATREKAESIRDLFSMAEASIGLVLCALVRCDHATATDRFDEIEQMGSKRYEQLNAATQVCRAGLYLLENRLDTAGEHYQRANEICQSMKIFSWQTDALVGLAVVSFRQGNRELCDRMKSMAQRLARKCGPLKMRIVELGLQRMVTVANSVPY